MVSADSARRCESSTSPVGPYFLCSCKESKQRKHAPKSASVRRMATNGSPLGAPCSGSRRRDILSRRRSAGRPVRLPHCARRPNRRSQGFEHLQRHLTARFASPQNNAKRSERCAVALACDVGPLVAHRAAQRAQGSAGRSPPSFVATGMSRRNFCPEHVSSARDFRAAKVRHQGVLSLGYFSLHKQREVTRPTGRKKTLKASLRFIKCPGVAR